jgi:hypothetical protein
MTPTTRLSRKIQEPDANNETVSTLSEMSHEFSTSRKNKTSSRKTLAESNQESSAWLPHPKTGEHPFSSVSEFIEAKEDMSDEQLYDQIYYIWTELHLTRVAREDACKNARDLEQKLNEEQKLNNEYARRIVSNVFRTIEGSLPPRQPSVQLSVESETSQAYRPTRSVKIPDPSKLTDGKSPKYEQ